MPIIKRNVKELCQNPNNPRVIRDKRFKELCKSIEADPKFLEARPIVLNTRTNTIVCGNQRLEAVRKLGWQEVTIFEEDLTDEEAERWMYKDNLHYGEHDFDVMANSGHDMDFFKSVGFDEKEMDKIMGKQDHSEDDEFDADEAAKQITEPTVQRGDIWQLGNRRLMCGDSTKKDDVDMLMDGKKADMVFTDPPYGVSYASKNEYLNSIARGNRIQTPIENDHMDLEDTSSFVYELFCQIKSVLAERSSYYITAPQGGDLMMMMMMMQKAGIPLRHCLIWVKNNHVLGRTDYNYKHEPILYGWVETHDFYGNGEHKFSTWEINKPTKNDLHPTMKPVALIENACLNSTKEGNIIVDLCLGSGSTLIACENLNRICYGMEIHPKYCDVIIKRWEDKTGKKAIKLSV